MDVNEFLETFCKVQINIPLLYDIKQIPSYAKILKDLCTNEKKLKVMNRFKSMKMYPHLNKRNYLLNARMHDFFIPCTIGDLHVDSVMLDIRASISVIPYSIFQSLNVEPLEEFGVIMQEIDNSSVLPWGVLDDVLVQVNLLIFPEDFFVIYLEEKTPSYSSMILLGRSFMNTAHTIIDVHKSNITTEFDGETTDFNMFEAMR